MFSLEIQAPAPSLQHGHKTLNTSDLPSSLSPLCPFLAHTLPSFSRLFWEPPTFLVSLPSCSPTTVYSSHGARATPWTFLTPQPCMAPWCLWNQVEFFVLTSCLDNLSSLIPRWSSHAGPLSIPGTCPILLTSGASLSSLYPHPFSIGPNHSGPSRARLSTISPWSLP